MEVFILSSGSADDGYSVEGVYSTEEKAREEIKCRFRCAGEVYRIECWEVDGKCKWVDFDDDEED
jgi:hypothetical protein